MPRGKFSSKTKALALLHTQIRHCDCCPLWRTRTQAVPGLGPADARIMLVGEAPGRQEDLRGEPFVGAAGKFLDELLNSIGLSRDVVFITNVVKSRPVSGGRNRAPRPDEVAACVQWLEQQLRIIRPELVVALGRVALDYFLPGQKISHVHGRATSKNGLTILPLYHPAMALYRRDWTAVLRRDFRKIPRLVNPKRGKA